MMERRFRKRLAVKLARLGVDQPWRAARLLHNREWGRTRGGWEVRPFADMCPQCGHTWPLGWGVVRPDGEAFLWDGECFKPLRPAVEAEGNLASKEGSYE